LAPGSAAAACSATDQRGIARSLGLACDIGAIESNLQEIHITGIAGPPGTALTYMDGTPQTVIADATGLYTLAVPPGWSGTITPSKPGYTFVPAARTYTGLAAFQTAQNYVVTNLLQDPGFEAFRQNPYWVENSRTFGSPLCKLTVCGNGGGTARPHSGLVWAWFGGTQATELASLSQTIFIPSNYPNLRLRFYLWIGAAAKASDAADVFTVQIDGVKVFSTNATQKAFYPQYIPVSIDARAWADGASHTIRFSSQTAGQIVTFNLDDVSLADVPSHTYTSTGSLDGWVLESGQTTGAGGSLNATAPILTVGNDADNKQYRAILHFDTSSLPDTAVITSVTLRVKKAALAGSDPFKALGPLLVDIRKPFFGTTGALTIGDFQAAASRLAVGRLGPVAPAGWYGVTLSNLANAFINTAGPTQFRLRFTRGDSNDSRADYVSFFSGNAPAASRPQLIIQYYVP